MCCCHHPKTLTHTVSIAGPATQAGTRKRCITAKLLGKNKRNLLLKLLLHTRRPLSRGMLVLGFAHERKRLGLRERALGDRVHPHGHELRSRAHRISLEAALLARLLLLGLLFGLELCFIARMAAVCGEIERLRLCQLARMLLGHELAREVRHLKRFERF